MPIVETILAFMLTIPFGNVNFAVSKHNQDFAKVELPGLVLLMNKEHDYIVLETDNSNCLPQGDQQT